MNYKRQPYMPRPRERDREWAHSAECNKYMAICYSSRLVWEGACVYVLLSVPDMPGAVAKADMKLQVCSNTL